jgi:alanine dehydrogenase
MQRKLVPLVLVPNKILMNPQLLTAAMVKNMELGSVIIDVAID